MPNAGDARLPRYRCHKEVWALKIKSVEFLGDNPLTADNPVAEITFEDSAFGPRTLGIRGKPIPQPGWYYVIYKDGYSSFSPPKEFEEGYTRIPH